MRFLCVSDVHGHRRALEAVLEQADARGWDQLVVCGDLCFPGPDPLGVWRLLVEKKALCVQGVSDRALARIDPRRLVGANEVERARVERLKQVHAELGELILARLGKLDAILHLDVETGSKLCVVHGSPHDFSEPFSHEMTDDEMTRLVADDPSAIIVCGGSHVPFDRQLERTRIVNVGSVGEPASEGFANATLLETTPFGVVVTQFDVALD